MLVEGSQHFNARWAVVDLMANSPQQVRIVAYPMPPVKNERPNEPSYGALNQRGQLRQVKQRVSLKPPAPGNCRQDHDSELAAVEKRSSNVPAGRFRQFPSWQHTLKDKKYDCCGANGCDLDHVVLLDVSPRLTQ